MALRQPIVIGADGLPQQLQSADTIPVPAYGSAGIIAGCKIWTGEATTTSAGAWSVDFTSASFTAPPRVIPSALSADNTIANSARALTTARSATAASGFVNLPNTIAVGGMPDKRAAAGVVVMVLAIGV